MPERTDKMQYVVVTMLVKTDAVVGSLPDLTSKEVVAWLASGRGVEVVRIDDAVVEGEE